MPLRKLTARERTTAANWQLAALLAFAAGTADVSSLFGLQQFTSHMSGNTARLATYFGEHHFSLMIKPGIALACFISGAAFCAMVVNWERRRNRESLYAVPMLLEAVVLACLSLPFAPEHVWLAISMVAFSMGLQNAIITKISGAEIRTTHVTGTVTDIGIELGRALYWNRSRELRPVRARRTHLLLLCMLVVLFFAGGTLSAVAFPHIGFHILLPVAAMLAVFTVLPITTDIRSFAAAR